MARLRLEPIEAVQAVLQADALVDQDSVGEAPAWKGAYLLAMRFEDYFRFQRGNAVHVFDPGWYAYAGNAYGPGGIGARLRRHFSREKRLHWHVDHLSCIAVQLAAVALKDGSECEIVSRLNRSGRFSLSVAGFGSSDCRTCRSHLLEWSD